MNFEQLIFPIISFVFSAGAALQMTRQNSADIKSWRSEAKESLEKKADSSEIKDLKDRIVVIESAQSNIQKSLTRIEVLIELLISKGGLS